MFDDAILMARHSPPATRVPWPWASLLVQLPISAHEDKQLHRLMALSATSPLFTLMPATNSDMLWVFISSATPGKSAFTTRAWKLSNVETRKTFPGVFAVQEGIPFVVPFATIKTVDFGLVDRDHHSSRRTNGTWDDDTE